MARCAPSATVSLKTGQPLFTTVSHLRPRSRLVVVLNILTPQLGMYLSPEREFVEHAIKFSQRQVEGKVSLVAYKGCAYVVGRSSETSSLYSADESSMDTLNMNWTPQDTSGFIAIQAIRLEKYGARKIKDGEPLARV